MTEVEETDVVVVGAGIAGLAAANSLRKYRQVVLEAADRPGGRLLSIPAGDKWLNLGAHMFGGAGTKLGALVESMHLDSRPIRGRLVGISYKGRRLLRSPPELYPFRLPLRASTRLSLIRAGVRLRLGTARLSALIRELDADDPVAANERLLAFENHRSLTELVGPLDNEAKQLLRAFTERSGADPDEMSAGHGLRSIANVWIRSAPSRNLVGGSSLLPEVLAASLGESIRLRSEVIEVRCSRDKVIVGYRAHGSLQEIAAKAVVVATPAFVARRVVSDMPDSTRDALGKVSYGSFLTAAILTSGSAPMPWDDTYAISTPARKFSVVFNMATSLGTVPRREGSSLMLFRGARGAEKLLEQSDTAIEAEFVDDLVAEFPDVKGSIRQVAVKRWETGAPFAKPGRARIQAALCAPLNRVFLAGDYLDFPNMESAVLSGQEAAYRATQLIDESHTTRDVA